MKIFQTETNKISETWMMKGNCYRECKGGAQKQNIMFCGWYGVNFLINDF